MNMKKVMLMGVLALGMSLGAMAQDNGQSYMPPRETFIKG